MRSIRLLAVLVLLAPAAFAQSSFTMTPEFGPESGGTVVIITGPFGSWPYEVVFGQTFVRTWRADDDTLVAVAPPGTGSVPVRVFEYDIFLETDLTFNYVHTENDDRERILLPLFTQPVNGANGSRFITEFRAANRGSEPLGILGLTPVCISACPGIPPQAIGIPAGSEVLPQHVVNDGFPGAFVYVEKAYADALWVNLRVFDDSRSADNFGTEIPVVREKDFSRDLPIVFTGVPTDPRFRTTLRIYATQAVTVTVDLGDAYPVRQVALRPGWTEFVPAYAQIGDLPSGVGPLKIRIIPPGPDEPGFFTPIWAFISVTNNETQLITTITP